ncbi:MAG TPA: hypothetical protein VG273_14130 [Bryobacteraceae bacterium]|jgi:hypothetical protein|nr:hypothetical protein [Bryobacteraceae bacterium]
MDHFHYIYAGLRVASEIELPEWAPFAQPRPAGPPDVTISIGHVRGDDLAAAENQRVITAGECRFLAPGAGCFGVRNGSEIVVAPAPDAPIEKLRPWLTGSAWASLCYQRGLFLFHASALLVDGAAVLFCSRAKGGKSTLAAELNRRGYPLVSDDLCHLRIPADGPPMIYPSIARLRLWDDALAELGWSPEGLEPDHARAGKYNVTGDVRGAGDASPVRGIYLLAWGDLAITPLKGVEGWRRFLPSATYRAKLLEPAEQLSRHSTRSMALLQRVPVWELRRPRDLTALKRVADLLRNHWSEAGYNS